MQLQPPANRKTREGDDHPDRDAQFDYINRCVTESLAARQPVISVDTKKKELVGDFRNAGREWRPQGEPEEVRVDDFLIKELGRAVPYGIYDLAANAGWVSVGMDHDTSAFAVQTIRRWWQDVGAAHYPGARHLTITADGGGSNASRSRLWKRELQRLAEALKSSASGLVLSMAAIGTVVDPAVVDVAVPASLLYAAWVLTRRVGLPMRLPVTSKLLDYSNPAPGSRKAKLASGRNFIGWALNGQELWMSGEDARQHMTVPGTTGAGKTTRLSACYATASGKARASSWSMERQIAACSAPCWRWLVASGARTTYVC